MIDLIQDQTLTSNKETKQIAVIANDADPLTYSAESAGSEAFFHDRNFNLRRNGSFSQNWGGENERWIMGDDGWYFIKPNGDFFRWDNTDKQATGDKVATLEPIFFYAPHLLYEAKKVDLVSQIDQSLGLSFSGSLWENFSREGERWLRGTNRFMGKNRPWYFIKPSGDLYWWDGTAGQASGILLARLDPFYHAHIDTLYNPSPQQLFVTNVGADVTVGPAKGILGTFAVEVAVNDGTETSHGYFSVTVVNKHAPVTEEIGDQTFTGAADKIVIPVLATDDDTDDLTYTATASGALAFLLDQDLNLSRNGTFFENSGGENERWIVGDDGWYFILPNGDFYRWDGNRQQLTGELIGSFEPIFYHAMDLLYNARDEDLVYQIDQRLGLTSSGNFWENYGGQGERWLQGSVSFMGKARPWYFILPNGDLYWWDGSIAQAKGVLLARLNPTHFTEIERLYNSVKSGLTASFVGNTLTLEQIGVFESFSVNVTVSDGIYTDSQTFLVTNTGFADSDNDGLTDSAEETSREATVTGLDDKEASRDVTSDPFQEDTDRDGLTDLEEALLKLDPNNADTDGDELTDFQEVRGFETVAFGVITTDPLDVDTDNDGRTDGEEAELDDVVADRWIVRVVGEDLHRVYSDPREADADFDQLLDGKEIIAGTDPNNADTDGDKLDDKTEAITIGLIPPKMNSTKRRA